MYKKIIILSVILFLFLTKAYSEKSIYIDVSVNDEIITNLDIEKESQYLKMLNPQLKELDKKKIYKIAKNSLINEIIKKNEVKKYFQIDREIDIIDKIYKDFFKNLGFSNENEFNNSLLNNKTYSDLDLKEKLKIDFFWNRIILDKFNDLVKIDKNILIQKIKNTDENKNEYFLSEILFYKDKNSNLDQQINNIKQSINNVGFNNTASIYSRSETANVGGKIGWISEKSLSQKIVNELDKIKIGEYTNVIKLRNNFLILKIEDKKKTKIETNYEVVLNKMIDYEKNKQLNQYSNIYFNKIKINNSINEF